MDYKKVDYSKYYVKNKGTYDMVNTDSIDEHTVEYIGKIKNDKTTPQDYPKGKKTRRERRSRGKAHHISNTLFVLFVIVSLFASTIFIADALKGGYILSEIKSVFSDSKDMARVYYGVEVRVHEDLDSARLHANELRRQGGAGYVINDGGYRVLVEVFDSEEDAVNIAKKLKLDGDSARVYEMGIRRIKYLHFPENTRNIVRSTIAFNDRAYKKLHAIGVALAKGDMDENTAKTEIDGLREETDNIIKEFVANVDDKADDINIVKVKAELVSIEATLDNLVKEVVKRPNLIADIRYTCCHIVSSYMGLTIELQ